MANPKQKRSRSHIRTRRRMWKAASVVVSTCPQCHQARRQHFACPNCGYYNGRAAVVVPEKPAKAAATQAR